MLSLRLTFSNFHVSGWWQWIASQVALHVLMTSGFTVSVMTMKLFGVLYDSKNVEYPQFELSHR